MTVRGLIPSSEIGLTSMHDHILADLSVFNEPITEEVKRNCPIDLSKEVELNSLSYLRNGFAAYCADNWNLTDADLMAKEVQYFKDRGGNSILEPSAPGIRYGIDKLRLISERTDVNIIASTGLYREETWPDCLARMGTADLRTHLMREINVGIDGTDIKAGHIKTAIANGSEREFGFLKTVVPVANETDLLVTAHTSLSTTIGNREKLLRTFLTEGMNPEKLLLCHIQFTFVDQNVGSFLREPSLCRLDLSWAKQILDSGANVCVDLFGYPSDNDMLDRFGQADTIKLAGLFELIKAGYAKQYSVPLLIQTKYNELGGKK
jgi:phosphotriesterase-related protein